MLLSAFALHGRVGAADEIALIVLGLLMVGFLAFVAVRSLNFKPELEESDPTLSSIPHSGPDRPAQDDGARNGLV